MMVMATGLVTLMLTGAGMSMEMEMTMEVKLEAGN